MKYAITMAMKISALTSVGLGGWYAGKKYERLQYSKIAGSSEKCLAPNLGIHSLPALPIFGTVSAASPIVPGDQSVDMGSKLSTTASRVSEVSAHVDFCKYCCFPWERNLSKLVASPKVRCGTTKYFQKSKQIELFSK